MHVVVEKPAATDARLRQVCLQSRVERMPGVYAYDEFEASNFPTSVDPRAIALVRDGERWSQLSVRSGDGEAVVVFAVHFPPMIDNSGFVGWLATLVKARHGAGVIVICGCNALRGGIFDYWGVPVDAAEAVGVTLVELFGTQSA